MTKSTTGLLFTDADWNFGALDRTYDALTDIAVGEMGLNIHDNQIEVITFEQMLDAYSSNGMPLMYPHWSFGKRFVRESHSYRRGHTGLAYEIVINSNPCISYIMEENTMAMQALVMAHACFGHNHFFKNNYLFQQWTDADGIHDYLDFAKRYILECEERHGREALEETLDSAHALMDQGVFRYRRPPKPSRKHEDAREKARREHAERSYNDLWRTLPGSATQVPAAEDRGDFSETQLPQENLLYFLEKHSPVLEEWQREILRIVRHVAQYFYPQKQTKVMNEGCATFVHYTLITELHKRGLITDGAFMEILHGHTSVVFQPQFDDRRYAGINPYALGFAMMQDIKRIAEAPTQEDRNWFPELAGSGDWCAALKHAWANYRDESFILQYLSPHLIRQFHLFSLEDVATASHYEVASIHDDAGYRKLRNALARSHDLAELEPDIQVMDADLAGDRTLKLRHAVRHGVTLSEKSRDQVLLHLKRLWGFDVALESVDASNDSTLHVTRASEIGQAA